ncbi:MAG: alpha/beta fold hydrolase [Lutimonas sp.]
MRTKTIFYLLFLQSVAVNAQENLYDFVKLGDYQVGFMDTLVLDVKYDYSTNDYLGQKPYFVQIWHPTKKEKKDYLNVKDFFVFKKNADLKNVQEQLTTQYKTLFIRDYLAENLITGEPNNYGKYSYEEVLDLIGELETRSIYDSNIGNSDFPVIIYHNGSQGHPFENIGMAEYFTSRGYIFIAASFELQFENNPFGMLPYERYITDEEEESLKSIVEFAKSLNNSSSIYFVGHSLGAQMGLRTFGQDSTIKGMISLETSIEFKTDYVKIKELWPEVYQKIITEKVNYPFPILFCAATGEEKPFSFLENVRAPQITYISTKTEFEHNAYLSFFYLRYFLGNEVQQTDKAILENRLPLYVKHLDVMHNFIDGILNNENKTGIELIFIKE